MIDLVKKLIPKKGFIWNIFPGSTLDNFLTALGEEPKRIKDFIKTIVRESNPETAIDTQEDWYDQYALIYEPTKSLKDKQAETLERHIALGDQDIVYLQYQIERAGFTDITLTENHAPDDEFTNECGTAECGTAECWDGGGYGADWIFYYFVTGTVESDVEYWRLYDLLQKLAPGHLIPVFSVISSDNEYGIAECGVSFCDG